MSKCSPSALRPAWFVVTANGRINKAVEAMRLRAYEILVKPFDETRFCSAAATPWPIMHLAPPRRCAADSPGADRFIGSSGPMQGIYQRKSCRSAGPMATVLTGESRHRQRVCAKPSMHVQPPRLGVCAGSTCGANSERLAESECSPSQRLVHRPFRTNRGRPAAADGARCFWTRFCENGPLICKPSLLRFSRPLTSARWRAAPAVGQRAPSSVPPMRNPLRRSAKGASAKTSISPASLCRSTAALRERGQDPCLIAPRCAVPVSAPEEGRNFLETVEPRSRPVSPLPWPGNVRQLLNVLRNIVVLNDGPVVTSAMLPLEIMQFSGEATPQAHAQQDLIAPKSDIHWAANRAHPWP